MGHMKNIIPQIGVAYFLYPKMGYLTPNWGQLLNVDNGEYTPKWGIIPQIGVA